MRMVTTYLLLIGVLCCGCGESGDLPPPSLPPQKKSVPPPQQAVPLQTNDTPSQPKPAASKAPKKPRRGSEETDEKTSNDFVIEQAPRDELIQPESVPPQNLFAVVAPVADSSFVSVTPPQEERTASQRPTRRQLGIKLPDGFAPAPDSGLNVQAFPDKIICEADGSEMILMEGGAFTRGADQGPEDVRPAHLVIVDSFYIDVHEVTLAQYRGFIDQVKAEEKRNAPPAMPQNQQQSETYPAVGVPWKDAVRYAETYGKALPTEAEWERAARGLQGNRYPWGNGRPLISSTAIQNLTAVKNRPADVTPTGLYDMAGNAREWTADWYSAETYRKEASQDGQAIRNPGGPRLPDKLGERVTRGGSGSWNLWDRAHANLRTSGENIGFRCVLRITPEMVNP